MTKFIPKPINAPTISPYLSIKGADTAIKFYTQVFGAKENGRLLAPNGTVMHCELQIGEYRILLAEESPEWCNVSPTTLGDSPVSITLYVENVDVTFQLALQAGAKQIMPIKDEFYGLRVGVISDPFGHKWHIHTPIEVVSFAEMQKRCDAMFAQ